MADEVQKVLGTVEYVKYQNEDNGFSIIGISCNNELIMATGILFGVKQGEDIELFGKFINHPVYGVQFNSEYFVKKLPSNVRGILSYLSSGVIKGIGTTLATRIVEMYKEDTMEILHGDIDKLCAVKGITRKKAIDVIGQYKNIFGINSVMTFFQEYGISNVVALKIYKIYGETSIGEIKNNPYILVDESIGIDFDVADTIAIKYGIEPDDMKRLTAGVSYTISHNTKNGHTCIPRKKLAPAVSDFLHIGSELIERSIEICIAENGVYADIVNGVECLFLPRNYMDERYIASRIALSINAEYENEDFSYIVDNYEEASGIKYNEMQKDAIKLAMSTNFMVLTGGPGTGKTTTINAIINVLSDIGLNVALCAPTGRAAQRIEKVTNREAKTIHRLLEVDYKNGNNIDFIRNEKNPLKQDVIIVDEISMVDVFLLSSLFKAVRFDCKLILVGDYNQLPSVGAGNILKDIIDSEKAPIIKLQEIFRQAAESLIITNSHKIINGEMPILDNNKSDFFFIKHRDRLAAIEDIKDIYINRLKKTYGFSTLWDIQILCPSRKGELGTYNLNAVIRDEINPKTMGKLEITYNGVLFRENDKVMQIKNNYDIQYEKDGEMTSGIYNGDIGVITKIDKLMGIVVVDFEGKVVSYEKDMLYQLELSYAITVHKSQGNEFEAVIMPLMENRSLLYYRNLLYTGVTRAKKILVLIGKEESIITMMQNNKKNLRYTGLLSFLKDEL